MVQPDGGSFNRESSRSRTCIRRLAFAAGFEQPLDSFNPPLVVASESGHAEFREHDDGDGSAFQPSLV